MFLFELLQRFDGLIIDRDIRGSPGPRDRKGDDRPAIGLGDRGDFAIGVGDPGDIGQLDGAASSQRDVGL
jgi:hypothetical protein